MAWIERLHATYEACRGHEPPGSEALLPVSHAVQQAHVEITIDASGNFKSARRIAKEETVIPATEQSAGRAGKLPPPHPLCDKVQYCAKDYPAYGGAKPSFFRQYLEQLEAWCTSDQGHPKVRAVLSYVRKGTVVHDLVASGVLHVSDGKLMTQWFGQGDTPAIFRDLTAKDGERDQGDAFVRWIVWMEGDLCPEVWKDVSVQEAWLAFDSAGCSEKGLCMVTGEQEVTLASSHPKRIRHAGDVAKLVSANDSGGFTFRGRFTDKTGDQAVGVGYVVTQKAHSALRWLIKRQAWRNGDQVILAWAVNGKPVPDPWADSLALINDATHIAPASGDTDPVGDSGQAFALRLRKAIAGYRSKLGSSDDVVIMGLDSATPGRMAITFYRELASDEFMNRIEAWHMQYAWPQNFGNYKRFVGAPAPLDIAEAAYGRGLDDRLRKATTERLLPCIADGDVIPRDLVLSVVRRASNRVGFGKDIWQWEKTLGIACALFRGYSKSQGKEYSMALEKDRTSRDYLYGRLLAVADNIEQFALTKAETTRDTMAARLMQRFADRPHATWRTIKLALAPYESRLKSTDRGARFLRARQRLLDEIHQLFQPDEFVNDQPLSGEFLLGYHCQRHAFFTSAASAANDQSEDQSAQEELLP